MIARGVALKETLVGRIVRYRRTNVDFPAFTFSDAGCWSMRQISTCDITNSLIMNIISIAGTQLMALLGILLAKTATTEEIPQRVAATKLSMSTGSKIIEADLGINSNWQFFGREVAQRF
jgi:hypothetical protein